MADSLTPWLQSYLTTTAESYGARIENVTKHEKKKKVQITEFLSYGSDDQDTYIWARVSDKQYIIPIKFSKEAIIEYASLPSNRDTRLTQHKGALVTIQKFRPISSRLPSGPGGAPTDVACLALECDQVSVLGGSGEGKFGNPVAITNNPDMYAWSEGLKQAGGAGNVLKDRRKEQLEQDDVAESSASALRSTTSLREHMPPPPVPASAIAPLRPASPNEGDKKGRGFWVGYRTKVTDMESYHARWKSIVRNPHTRFRPDENTLITTAEATDIPDHDAGASRDRSRSATPLSDWDNTQSSPGQRSQHVSSLSMPTPAQRQKSPSSTPHDMPSSSPRGDETKLDIEVPISQPQSVAKAKRPVARKVPRPVSPKSIKHDGPARVLVPNSDTSGTQSQSQSQSQSQPHVDDIERLNEERLASQQARNANQGAEELNEDEKSEDEHAAREAEMFDAEAPRGSEASSPKTGPRRSEREGTRTRVNGNTRESAGRGADAVEEEEEPVEDDTDEAMEAEQDGEERWPWMDLWAVRAVAAATREARLGNSVGLIR